MWDAHRVPERITAWTIQGSQGQMSQGKGAPRASDSREEEMPAFAAARSGGPSSHLEGEQLAPEERPQLPQLLSVPGTGPWTGLDGRDLLGSEVGNLHLGLIKDGIEPGVDRQLDMRFLYLGSRFFLRRQCRPHGSSSFLSANSPGQAQVALGPGWNGFWRGPGVGFGAAYWAPTGSRGARNPATMVTISAGLTSSVHLEPSSES